MVNPPAHAQDHDHAHDHDPTRESAGPVRVATVSYLNAVPMVHGLEATAGIDLIRAVPSRIASMILDGSADIGLASIIDAARAGPTLAALLCGMIGCDGPTLTVRLFSSVPFAAAHTLHADTDSKTSVALAQVILSERFGVRPEVRPFHARERTGEGVPAGSPDEAWPETLLLIGDKVVTGSPPAVRYPHQLDLGEAWHALTGLPFVYALWFCRASETESRRVRTASALVDRQRRRNALRLDRVISDAAPARGWPADLARRYVGTLLRYAVGTRERAAADEFLRRAHALDLCPEASLRWADAANG